MLTIKLKDIGANRSDFACYFAVKLTNVFIKLGF